MNSGAVVKKFEWAYLSKEPGNDVAKDDALVGFVVAGWCGYSCQIPEITFPFIDAVILAAGIEEKDVGVAINQPAPIKAFYSLYTH
jgi:hypothetical protein